MYRPLNRRRAPLLLLSCFVCLLLLLLPGGLDSKAFAQAVTADPGGIGPYHDVTRIGYNFGQDYDEWGDPEKPEERGWPLGYEFGKRNFPDRPVEFIGEVYYPNSIREITGALPLIVVLHGRHWTCRVPTPEGTTEDAVWPCSGSGKQPIWSYQGYRYLLSNLATQGYIVVSISANGITMFDGPLFDWGANARNQLIQFHINYLAQCSAGNCEQLGNLLVGKVDLGKVGLIGHSRGGEGVVYNATRSNLPYSVRAVLPIAPVDVLRTPPLNVNTGVLLGYCDGDVTSLPGVHYFDDNRYANSTEMRHTFLMLGANHNYFNEVWSLASASDSIPDDWEQMKQERYQYPATIPNDSHCDSLTERRTPAQQRAATIPYVNAFFLNYLYPSYRVDSPEHQFHKFLTGDVAPPASAQGARIYAAYHAINDTDWRRDINRLVEYLTDLNHNDIGGMHVQQTALVPYTMCGGDIDGPGNEAPERHCLPANSANLGQRITQLERQPHTSEYIPTPPPTPTPDPNAGFADPGETILLKFGWDGLNAYYRNPVLSGTGLENFTTYESVQFRAGVNFTDGRNGPGDQNFKVVMKDKQGQTASLKITDVYSGNDIFGRPRANPLYFPPGDAITFLPVPHLVLHSVRIPLTRFTTLNPSLDLSSISSIEFVPDSSNPDGALIVSDFALTNSQCQTPPPCSGCPVKFQDVTDPSTFAPYIKCLVDRNIVSGYPCGGEGEPCVCPDHKAYFRPGTYVTRGQLSKMVSLSAAYTDTPTGQAFEDVLPGSTFYTFIQQLASRGHISGYPCGTKAEEPCQGGNRPYFRPHYNVTRGQITKIVSNARGYGETPPSQTFYDVPPAQAFYAYVYRLYSRGYVSGYPCGGPGEPCDNQNRPYFRPNDLATRGQVSKIVSFAFFNGCSTGQLPNGPILLTQNEPPPDVPQPVQSQQVMPPTSTPTPLPCSVASWMNRADAYATSDRIGKLGLRADFYDNDNFTGPKITRIEPGPDVDWAGGSPDPSIGVDTYSARWHGKIRTAANSGSYTFEVTSDDGVRLWVAGVLVIDAWTEHAPTTYTGSITLNGNTAYDIRLDYFERGGGAMVRLKWRTPAMSAQTPAQAIPYTNLTPATNGLLGEYFDNMDFTGTRVALLDRYVSFNWRSSGPHGLGPDQFSVRWTGYLVAPVTGTYTFYSTTDDGDRLWVNGIQIINRWFDEAEFETSGVINLEAGVMYPIKYEFYENGYGAMARLAWQPPGGSKEVIPASHLITNFGDDWTSGGTSSQIIPPTKNGYVQTTIDSLEGFRMVGLTLSDATVSFADIDYAMYTHHGGTLQIYEKGKWVDNVGSYAVGDDLKVAIEGGKVQYYRRPSGSAVWGVLLTSVRPFEQGTYRGKVAFYSPYASYYNVRVCAGTGLTSPPQPWTPTAVPTTIPPTSTPTPPSLSNLSREAIEWTSPVNVSASGNTVQKTGGVDGNYDGGAVSTQFLPTWSDGYVEAKVPDTNKGRAFGLSTGNTDPGFNFINYAIRARSSGDYVVLEQGVEKTPWKAYAVGDIFRVAKAGTTVTYYRNGILLYTSLTPVPANTTLYMDVSLAHLSSSITEAFIADNSRVRWANLVNVTANGNTLQKSGGVEGQYDGGALSQQYISASSSGYVEAKVEDNTRGKVFGLNVSNTDPNFAGILYGIRARSSGDYVVIESNVEKTPWKLYSPGDVFRVAKVGTSVNYYRNGILLYTSLTPVQTGATLYMDASLSHLNSTLLRSRLFLGTP